MSAISELPFEAQVLGGACVVLATMLIVTMARAPRPQLLPRGAAAGKSVPRSNAARPL
jgi:hypothetical protein